MCSWKMNRTVGVAALIALAALIAGRQLRAQDQLPADSEQRPETPIDQAVEENAPSRGWTLQQAMEHLKLYPRDAYVQYVAMQLAVREGRQQEIAAEISRGAGMDDRRMSRQTNVDAFSIFSGALAVQESLQLEEMLGDLADQQQQQQPADGGGRVGPQPVGGERKQAAAADVPVADIERPIIKSHPWHEMLAGRTPEVSLLSKSVPDDFFFVEFRSVNKLLEATELSDLWGRRVFNQSMVDAQTQLVNERIRQQLAVEDSPLLRPFYDNFVEGVAATGSDLFLREGSDLTLLFQMRQPAAFKAQMNQFLVAAEKSRSDARRTTDSYHGVEVVHVATPDRTVFVYSAYPTEKLHVRTNSRVALERVVDAIRGKTPAGEPVVRLGDTEEFQYIRTILPLGAKEEDGFVYLSDPFIRKLVGPELRLIEGRRLRCYNHLKMIGHAALMYRTERGQGAASLGELHTARCTPAEFGQGKLACPDGGEYSLAADGLTGVCSCHGYASYLTPCNEIELERVTEAEATAYRNFLRSYNEYWRTFFDPIAIRLTITPQRYRAETIVLPLIDNSIYTGLASSLGGEPEQLDQLPVPKRNIFSFAVRLNKEELLKRAGMEGLLEDPGQADAAVAAARDTQRAVESLRSLVLAMHNHESAVRSLPAAAITDKQGKPLLSWRVRVLPYLGVSEAQNLYDEFRIDEPWDSEHNRKLISRMPAVFRSANDKLNQEGKTRFVVPVGEDTLFPSSNKAVRLADASDGLSNTIALLEVEDDDAVIWTKPEDVAADAQTLQKLASRPRDTFLSAFGDGSVKYLSERIDDASLAVLYTKSGGENVNWWTFDRTPRTHMGPFGRVEGNLVYELELGKFLARGIGNQVAFHAYDSEPLVGFNLSQVVGMSVSSFRGGGRMDDDFIWIGMLVGSLNSPVYLSVPVKDRQIVDDFLARLDKVANEQAHEPMENGFFELQYDYYRLESGGETPMRGYSLRFGPVKWRFFWQRIGDGLYMASKPEVLKDIAALQGRPPAETAPAAHAMVRIRPEHWDRVLSDFRLGWAENNRQACLKNCGPLHSLARAVGDGASTGADQLQEYAARLYDVHYFCPDGGEYSTAADGTVCCSVHGSAHEPRQGEAPAPASDLGRLMQDFSDMTVSLIFLEDGLHAIVDLERTPPASK